MIGATTHYYLSTSSLPDFSSLCCSSSSLKSQGEKVKGHRFILMKGLISYRVHGAFLCADYSSSQTRTLSPHSHNKCVYVRLGLDCCWFCFTLKALLGVNRILHVCKTAGQNPSPLLQKYLYLTPFDKTRTISGSLSVP